MLTLKRVPGVSDTTPLTIINESPGGGTGVVYQSTASDQGFLIAHTTAQSSVAWVEGVNWGGSNEFIIKSGSNGLTLKPTGDAVISGNLDVDGVMNTTTMNLTSDVWDNFPLVITNNGDNWFQGEYIANANNVGCLFRYKTSGSSSYWWSGVWGSNTNDCNIRFDYKGLSIKSNASAVRSGNLDVGLGQANTSIKTYVNYGGHAGNVEIEARWQYEAYIYFNTTYVHGLLVVATKQVIYMFCGLYQIYFYKPTTNASDDRLKENE